jgi:hypothetical protein
MERTSLQRVVTIVDSFENNKDKDSYRGMFTDSRTY